MAKSRTFLSPTSLGLYLALRSYWGRMRVALEWLWGRNWLPTACLPNGFGVALRWLWVALPSACHSGEGAVGTTKHVVQALDGGAGRTSSRLQVEAQVSSVQRYDEPIEDFTPDQHVLAVSLPALAKEFHISFCFARHRSGICEALTRGVVRRQIGNEGRHS